MHGDATICSTSRWLDAQGIQNTAGSQLCWGRSNCLVTPGCSCGGQTDSHSSQQRLLSNILPPLSLGMPAVLLPCSQDMGCGVGNSLKAPQGLFSLTAAPSIILLGDYNLPLAREDRESFFQHQPPPHQDKSWSEGTPRLCLLLRGAGCTCFLPYICWEAGNQNLTGTKNPNLTISQGGTYFYNLDWEQGRNPSRSL